MLKKQHKRWQAMCPVIIMVGETRETALTFEYLCWQVCGKVGRVRAVDSSCHVTVRLGSQELKFHASCLMPALGAPLDDEKSEEQSNGNAVGKLFRNVPRGGDSDSDSGRRGDNFISDFSIIACNLETDIQRSRKDENRLESISKQRQTHRYTDGHTHTHISTDLQKDMQIQDKETDTQTY